MKNIEAITNKELEEIWPLIGGAPHLFEYGKDELRAMLIDGFPNTDDGELGIQLDYYTMAAIVDYLRNAGYETLVTPLG